MRICIFTIMGGGPWGGSEELWAATARAALDEGHAVAIVSKRCPEVPAPIAALQARGAEVFWRKHDQSSRVDRQVDRRVYPLPAVARWRPDVVLVNLGTFYALAYRNDGERWMARLGVPYVIVSHHNHDIEGGMTDPLVYRSHVEFYRKATRVAFVAEANRQAAYRQLATGLPDDCVVRNPVNLTDWDAVPWPVARDPALLATVARLDVRYKGHDILLEALAGDAWRDRPWSLRVYGRGPDLGYLKDLVAHFGLGGRVEFRGHVGDIRSVWAENHLLAMPSRSEGTPLSLVEAQICGRPSVVTDVGGNAEWVEEPTTGFVADSASVRSFGAALGRAWEARSSWEEMGAAAHRGAVAKADPEPGRSMLGILAEAAGRAAAAGVAS